MLGALLLVGEQLPAQALVLRVTGPARARAGDRTRLGVLPLAINSGAGSGSQNAIGTGIVGGAITTTLLGLFFVPLYFVTVLRLFKVKPLHAPAKEAESPKAAIGPDNTEEPGP